ncbi:hypothetical protein Dacet_2016 [Denitrovibrio acetiphilus DSM 12809]|uniref:DUF3784 domain-containing protein n=1 Tax=Denitrovibrio acetiphilus (strain DSM 12809 / NBRC 114555 / N2460) TaxID=522772 RepID=D4H1L9_DENA2|nr:hypothetical protein [Denitrovibrio acetiphilus]ADD68779.1 hypothetical protein Dacet_2016 [Denitrovibrio acetiphilus DSM 12809]
MEFNTDTILLFMAGMILGGYFYIKVETLIMEKYYAGVEGETRVETLKKVGFGLTFIGVFLFVLTFILLEKALPSGIFAGFAIFGIRP